MSQNLTVVLTPAEVSTLLNHLSGSVWLMGVLMYPSGLRVIECLRLRDHLAVNRCVYEQDLRTTQFYTHLTGRGASGVRSPLEQIFPGVS
jgi:site-specific recombinase XerD